VSKKLSKYIPWMPVSSLDGLYHHLTSGGWVYLRGKVKHPSIILNMTYSTVAEFVKSGALQYAKER
jgi:hypothetical protein